MQVLVSRDRVWRAEQRGDGWRLTEHGGVVLDQASLDQVVRHLLAAGVDPDRDLIPG